jgi:hypothetical protein
MPMPEGGTATMYRGTGAPATTTGLLTDTGGSTYAGVEVGDLYTDKANGKVYTVTAVAAGSITWQVVGAQVP